MRISLPLSVAGLCFALAGADLVGGPVPINKPAHYPDWWFERDIITRIPASANITTPAWPIDYMVADDYAVANIGQLKNMASAAAAELELKIAGGAGVAILTQISTWQSPPATNVAREDYSALNIGQLKSISSAFYDRLLQAGYTGAPLSVGQVYPWSNTPGDDDDYALANLGQLKHAFSFNIEDTDQDGLPDYWEINSFGSLTFTANNDTDGDGADNHTEWQIGTNPLVRDTDLDGLSDSLEVSLGLNPLFDDLLILPEKLAGRRLHLSAENEVFESYAPTEWKDKSGLNNHATQTSVSLRPQRIANAVNGRPVVRFDGANDQLTLPNLMSGATAGEILAVLKLPRTTNRTDAFWALGASTDYIGSLYHTDGLQWDDFGTSAYRQFAMPDVATLQNFHIYNSSSKPGEWTNRLNGVPRFTTSTNTVAFRTNPAIGTRLAYGHFVQGDIAEILLLDRVLTPQEREAVNTYFARKYALVPIPSTPANLTATPISATQSLVAWTPASSTYSHTYVIEQLIGGIYTLVAEVTDSSSTIISGLASGSSNQFRVSVRNGAGTSSPSAPVTSIQPLSGLALPTAGIRLWLKADSGLPVSGALPQWQDQSGLQNHATSQGLGSPALPQVVQNAVNGRPVVRFDGADDRLSLPNLMSGAAAGEILAVMKLPRTTNRTDAFWALGASTDYIGSLYHTDGLQWDDFGTSAYRHFAMPDVAALQNFHIYNSSSKPGEWTNRFNGVPRFTTYTNTVSFRTNPAIGTRLAYGHYVQGDIAEVLLFDRVLTSQEREAVNTYFARKYALVPAPSPAASFTATPISATQSLVAWTPASSTYSHTYVVEQLVGGIYTTVAEVTDSSSSIINGLAPGSSNQFRVSVRNGAGTSSPSVPATSIQPLSGLALPTAGIRLWLKADSGLPVSGALPQWQDQSGLQNHATSQGLGSPALPQVVQNAVNGRPVVRFDGADDRLSLPNLMSGAAAGEILAVMKLPRTTNRTDAFWALGASTDYIGSLYHTDGLQWDDFGTSAYRQFAMPDVATLQNFHIYNSSSKPGEWTNRLNGVPRFTTSTNTVAFRTNPAIGTRLAYGHFVQGDIAEILLFDRVLTPQEREAVNTYFARKYGILGDYLTRTDGADFNGDGLADSIGSQLGYSSSNYDLDGDGVPNATELAQGTDPFLADTDGDGVNDGADYFPLDPTRSSAPSPTPGDTTAPAITLDKPAGAVLQP